MDTNTFKFDRFMNDILKREVVVHAEKKNDESPAQRHHRTYGELWQNSVRWSSKEKGEQR
jgi:hypothetical protein